MASEPLTVRPARLADAETIAQYNCQMALETEGLRLDPPTVLAGVQAALADEHKALYFVAEIGGQVAGQLMITHEWSDWRNGDIWWIQSVYVAAAHRRKGVFHALYQHVQTAAKEAGAVGIRLYVERENSAAQGTYRALGMDLTHYLVMEKMLS